MAQRTQLVCGIEAVFSARVTLNPIIDHLSGLGSAIGIYCVRTTTFERNNTNIRYGEIRISLDQGHKSK